MAWSIIESFENDINGQRDERQLTMRDYTRNFTITTDSTSSNSGQARVALATQGVDGTNERIAEGAAMLGNGLYICDSVSVKAVSSIFYTATATYKTPKLDPNNEEPEDPILARPVKVSYSTVSTEEPVDTDVNDDPLETSTGEIFQGRTRTVSDLKATITKLYDTFTPSSFYEYQDTVNSDTFLGFPPGTAKVMAITATQVEEQQRPYWEVTVEVLFRKPYRVEAAKAWYLRILHEGYYCFTLESLETPVRITDGNLEPVSQPQKLGPTGLKLLDGEEPEWLTFQIYETSTFSGMNLGV